MAKQALSNSFTDFNGRVGTFVGPAARPVGKLSVGRLDGTGLSATNTQAYTTSPALPVLVLFYGDSHMAGSPYAPPRFFLRDILPFSGAYAAITDDFNFSQGGLTALQLVEQKLPPLLDYIAANKANYAQVIVYLEGWINSLTYANGSETNDIIGLLKSASYQMARAGAKVILVPAPPSRFWQDSGNPTQQNVVETMRQAINNAAIDSYLDFGATGTLSNYRQDATLYPLNFDQAYPANKYDSVHYSSDGYKSWTHRHLLPELLRVAALPVPVRPVPTGLQVDTGAKRLSWSATAPLALHDYSLDAGATFKPVTAYPVPLPDGDYQVGSIRVRVAAYGGGAVSNSLTNTAAYTIGTPTPPPTPGYVDAVFQETVNSVVTGNSWVSNQPYNFKFESAVYTKQKLVGQVVKLKVIYDAGLQQFAYTGFRPAGEPASLDSPVPFPRYGVRMGGGQWSPTMNDGNSASFPISDGDAIEAVRDSGFIHYFQNGTPMFSSDADLAGDLYVMSMAAFPGAGAKNIQLFSDGSIVNR
jgi:hypothetical protein